jgi:hypothetical protein
VSQCAVIDLDDYRPVWASGPAICGKCGHRVVSTYPAGSVGWKPYGAECSACGEMAVVMLLEAHPDREER